MDDHNGGGAGKLTRTASSLLRSPTVRNCSSFQAVLVEDPEPDDKKSQATATQRKALHPHAGPAHAALILTLPLGLLLLMLLLRDDLHLLLAAAAAAALAAAAAARLLRGHLRMRRSPQTGSVQWFIGDDDDKPHNVRDARGKAVAAHGRIVREGVEFYSNGDSTVGFDLEPRMKKYNGIRFFYRYLDFFHANLGASWRIYQLLE
ncbi:junctophilin-1 [Hordeum vulgare]|nr:junctophilin-1 [Hordeum vulgare]